jgi:hypothetical protein
LPLIPLQPGALASSPTPTSAAGQVDARVLRVIDGDTIEFDIEGKTYRVRYLVIDLPEPEESPGSIATLANRQLVEGQTVRLGNATVAAYRCEIQPPLRVLEAEVMVKVHTGWATMSTTDLYWCKDQTAIWNNGGDTVHRQDADGALILRWEH